LKLEDVKYFCNLPIEDCHSIGREIIGSREALFFTNKLNGRWKQVSHPTSILPAERHVFSFGVSKKKLATKGEF